MFVMRICNHENKRINPKTGKSFLTCYDCAEKEYNRRHGILSEPLTGMGVFRVYVGDVYVIGASYDLQGSETSQELLLKERVHPIERLQRLYRRGDRFRYEAVSECVNKDAMQKLLRTMRIDCKDDPLCCNPIHINIGEDKYVPLNPDLIIKDTQTYRFIHKKGGEECLTPERMLRTHKLNRSSMMALLEGKRDHVKGWRIVSEEVDIEDTPCRY